MERSYWSQMLRGRINRRRALVSTGGFAAGAAFLAACGDDGDGGTTGATGTTGSGATGTTGAAGATGSGATGTTGATGTSDLLAQPVHTLDKAVRGGVFKDWSVAEPRNLDPITAQAGLVDNTEMVYNTIITEKPGKLEPSAYEIEGALAQAWEISPDGLQITFKLRQGVKWHNIAPVSGRAFDAEDVLAAMNRHAEKSGLRTIIWNSAAPSAVTLAPTAPDSHSGR